jgi:pyridoxine/pyridoxamine 5'-phosphate oxidase
MPWPGYDPPSEGRRLLPWAWAVSRLRESRRYWLATTDPSGAPRMTAVWGVWIDGSVVFSTGMRTRKALNLNERPECTIATESAEEAVVVRGTAEVVNDDGFVAAVDDAYRAKYGSSMLVGDSAVFAVRPRSVTGIVDSSTSFLPTVWQGTA